MVVGVGCRGSEARFVETFAPDFQHARHTVSVFGVFKDGQVSSEAWDALRPHLDPLLGGSQCAIACDARLAASDTPLFSAIDDYTRANGPSDDLLAELAPAALGDLILVLVEDGKLPEVEKLSIVDSAPTKQPGPNPGHGSGFSAFESSKRRTGESGDRLQLSASLYSIAQGRSVALLDLRYSGTSREEAIDEFAARLARALPETRCGGWAWRATVDADHIRRLTGG
jgi:hypothetical protein